MDKIKETTKKWKSSFSILHDFNNKIMNDYKVAFEVNEKNVPNYLSFTLNKIREYNENENNILYIPVTYTIKVKKSFLHCNINCTNRASFVEIVKNLK